MSIISYATYVRLSGDTVTASATAMESVDDAVAMLDDVLNRTLTFGTYTETVKVSPKGFSYPRAIPLTSVAASAVYELYDTVALHRVTSNLDELVTTLDFPYLDHDWAYSALWPTAQVTYDGGYTEATLPFTLKVAIALLAKAFATNPGGYTPPGAGSMSVGDVSVSLTATEGKSLLDAYVPGLYRTIGRRRRRSP